MSRVHQTNLRSPCDIRDLHRDAHHSVAEFCRCWCPTKGVLPPGRVLNRCRVACDEHGVVCLLYVFEEDHKLLTQLPVAGILEHFPGLCLRAITRVPTIDGRTTPALMMVPDPQRHDRLEPVTI